MMSALVACNGEHKPAENTTNTQPAGISVPAVIPYDVVSELPHDPKAFTEGLEYCNGVLFESTGQYGSSDIRNVDIKTGKVLLTKKIDDKYIGEGLTNVNGKLYQLTYWRRVLYTIPPR